VQRWPILIISSTQHREAIRRKMYTSAHFILILLLQYLVKCRSRSLAVYNNEFILESACVGSKITETAKSLKTCYIFNNSRVRFKIVRRQTKMTHQQRVSRSGSRVIERAVGESRQRPLLAFVLEETF